MARRSLRSRPALTIRSRQSRGLRRGDGGRHALLCQQVRNVLRHVCTIPLADSLMTRSGATFATLMGAGATVLVFKLSELASTYNACRAPRSRCSSGPRSPRSWLRSPC